MICPNCSKSVNDNFSYCNGCGFSLDGGDIGDFSTDIFNVFTHPEGFIYLFSMNGIQMVLKADNLEELESLALKNKLFWIHKDSKPVCKPKSERKPVRLDKTHLKVSSGDAESRDKFTFKPKRNPSKPKAEKKLSVDCGILGVSKEYYRSRLCWVYRSGKSGHVIRKNTLADLESAVKSKNLKWDVVDGDKAYLSFKKDKEDIEMRDAEIIKKNNANSTIDFNEKSLIKKQCLESKGQIYDGNNTELDKHFR